MHVSWRTLAPAGALTLARQPHPFWPANGRAATVRAPAFINPHSLLGVCATADVKEVKRAYRKLALQYHPDVCKSEDGHERFMALTQAYEMLLGKAEGKTDPNHASSSSWDFHDWYWNFRMQRSWEKQQRQAAAAAGADAAGGPEADPSNRGRQPPHAHAACQQPEGREKLRSQLAGLRHRAAVRANRPASGASTAAASPAASCAAEADSSDAGAPDADSADGSGSSPHASPVPDARSPDMTWSWWDETVELDDEPATAAAAGVSDTGDEPNGGGLHGQYTHTQYIHDGHYGTVVANHAVPFPGGRGAAAAAAAASSQREQQKAEQQQQTEALEAEHEAEPEPFSNPFDQQPHAQHARRRFSGDSVTRESVSHQLAGLRRKAAMKTSS